MSASIENRVPRSVLRAAILAAAILAHAPTIAAGPLGLLDCYRLALHASEKLGIVEETREQAEFQKDRVVAAILPHATAKYRVTRIQQVPNFGGGSTGSGGSIFPRDQAEAWLNVTQPIFSGFRDLIAQRQANSLIDSKTAAIAQAKLDLFSELSVAFYEVLAAERGVTTLDGAVALQADRLREIEARQSVGLARKTEVLLIQTQLAKDQSRLVRARGALEIARANLGFIIGQKVEGALDDTFPIIEPVPPVEDLVVSAEERRQDLSAAESEVSAAANAVKVIEREIWPVVQAEANYYGKRVGFLEDVDWDIALTADLPLYTGGDRKARAADARSKLRQAELTRDGMKRSIALEVKEAYVDLQREDSLLVSLASELRSAEENHKLLLEEYRQGLATNLEVHTASNLMQDAALQLEFESYRRKAAWVRLHATTGAVPGATID